MIGRERGSGPQVSQCKCFFCALRVITRNKFIICPKKKGEKKRRRKKEENLKAECFGTSTKLHLHSAGYVEIFVLNRVCVLCVSVCYRKTDVSMLKDMLCHYDRQRRTMVCLIDTSCNVCIVD